MSESAEGKVELKLLFVDRVGLLCGEKPTCLSEVTQRLMAYTSLCDCFFEILLRDKLLDLEKLTEEGPCGLKCSDLIKNALEFERQENTPMRH